TTPSQENNREKKSEVSPEIFEKSLIQKDDKVLGSFFDTEVTNVEKPSVKEERVKKDIVKSFDDDRDSPANRELSLEIEQKLLALMEISCFDIDTVEVDVFNKTAHIFIDGEDAALLIGKEGYRYNALSYMLFNWINAHHDLYIKLEIAEFIQAQEEMIVNYLKPIIEHISEKGRGKTKPLDGILVQIALEQLRAAFPNKYVAIKTGRDGKKFIIVNNFNSKKNV
nr:protein jag [Campylobacterota bacterium]